MKTERFYSFDDCLEPFLKHEARNFDMTSPEKKVLKRDNESLFLFLFLLFCFVFLFVLFFQKIGKASTAGRQ